jgi:hypothetical protein
MHLLMPTKTARVVVLTVITTLVCLGLVAGAVWLYIGHQASPVNPFASSLPSASFPLYYSTKLPAGYTADPKSVNEPQAGVILYNLVKGTHKIVISEEARSDKMVNIGAFYQSLKDSKQTIVSDGAIATGYFGSMEVASRANNTTWIIATTTDNISFSQLTAMLKNLSIAT